MRGDETEEHLFMDHEDGDTTCSLNPDHARALRARASGAPAWGVLERRDEGANGWRDYLDGRAIHCGAGLELQSMAYRSDDYGEYSLRSAGGVRVRYEVAWGKVDRYPVLHTVVGGHEFQTPVEPWMRFRWPVRE